jgi:hypothetical protein
MRRAVEVEGEFAARGSLARLLVIVLACAGCGGASTGSRETTVVPTAATSTTASATAAPDVCQRAIGSFVRDLPLTANVTLFTTPGVADVDAKATALDGWLSTLATTAGKKIDYRWIGVTDEASRKYATNAGLTPAALAKPGDDHDRAVVLGDTYFGVAIGIGVDDRPVAQLGNTKPSAARAWIANAAQSAVARFQGRTRRVGFVVGGSASGGVLVNQTELAPAGADGSRSSDLSEHLRRIMPNHEFLPVELTKGVPETIDVLLLTQPGGVVSEAERRRVDEFLMRGEKTVVVAASSAGVAPYTGTMRVDLDAHGLDRLVGPYGVTVSDDVIADPERNLRIDVVRGDGSRAAVTLPAIPIVNVESSSAPFFTSKTLAFPFASSLNVQADRQPGAHVRVIARTAGTATSSKTSGTDLGPDAREPLSKGTKTQSYDVAVEVQGDVRSAFGNAHAPATLYVLSSSLLFTNPFAWSGNPPPQASPMMPPSGEPRLQQLAQAYAPHLTNAFLVLMNAIDARVVNDDVRACNALLASDGSLEGPSRTAGRHPDTWRPLADAPVLTKEQVARISKLEIRAGASAVTVERSGSSWRVVSPLSGQADAETVRKAIENLTEMRVGEVIANGTTVDANLGLSAKDALHVIASAGADHLLDVTIGRSGERGTAVRVAGSDAVRLMLGVSRWLFDAQPKRWRRTQLWQFDKSEVLQVRIESARGKWLFDRTPAGWKATALAPDRVVDLVNAFRQLRADDFAEQGADTGLDSASAPSTVRFVLGGGRQQTIEISASRKGGGRYARVPGDSTIYVISEYTGAWSEPSVERFSVRKP